MQIYDIEQSKDIHRSMAISLHFNKKEIVRWPKILSFICVNERTERREKIKRYVLPEDAADKNSNLTYTLTWAVTRDNQTHG